MVDYGRGVGSLGEGVGRCLRRGKRKYYVLLENVEQKIAEQGNVNLPKFVLDNSELYDCITAFREFRNAMTQNQKYFPV